MSDIAINQVLAQMRTMQAMAALSLLRSWPKPRVISQI